MKYSHFKNIRKTDYKCKVDTHEEPIPNHYLNI